MKTSAILLGLAAVLAVCGATPVYKPNYPQGVHHVSAYLEETGHVADKDLAIRQKLILQLLEHVHQETKYPELIELGKNWDPEHMIDRYANQRVIKKFVSLWKQGTLPRGELFHVYNDVHLKEVIALFDMLYFAKDFDTFIKTAAWARDNVNEGQFAYALSVAVVHRDDCEGLVLPPLYEVYPHFYINGNDMSEFESAKMKGHFNYVLNTNWTNGKEIMNTEDLVGYFTEDVGLNAYNAYAHLYQPFWMNCEKYNMDTCKNRGEAYYYFYQQLLAHYNLHRMANYLPEMELFDWENPIKYGYNPELKYHNGKTFPMRPDNQEISSIKSYTTEDIKNIEARIKDAIDSGYVIGKDGNKISIKNYMQGINILGNIVEGNEDSVNSRYYASYSSMLRNLFALIMDPTNEHGVAPGVIGHYETALRDPAFYYFQEYVNRLFKQYKDNLPSYRPEELYFNGVAVKDVAVDKLVTYFDLFDVDVTRGVDVASVDEAEKLQYVARTMRLNHKPFTYKVKVQSEKKTSAVVRVFLGPNTDYVHSNFYGDASDVYTGQNTQDLDRLRHYFVELDRFPVTLKNGENLIERHSREFTTTVGDVPSYNSLKKMAESGNFYIRDVDSQCGFPDRLVLPMGHKAGMPFTLFVMVTPYGTSDSEDHSSYYADSAAAGHQRKIISCNGLMTTVDNRPLGFPFDRQIQNYDRFYTPNMYFKDIVIYHKDAKDITSGNVVVQGGNVVITKNVNDFDHLPKYAAGQHQTVLDEDVSVEDMHM